MTTDTWNDLNDNWNTSGDWSPGLPISTSDVVVAEGDPQVTSPVDVNSITDSAIVTFIDAGASTVAGAFDNSGSLFLDSASGDGGSELAIGGELTNNIGVIQIGNAALSAADTVSTASITNFNGSSYGEIDLSGGASTQAKLDIDRVASFGVGEVLEGDVDLSGDALIEFDGVNPIKTIASDGHLVLSGHEAFIADASLGTTSNSALTGLSKIDGELDLEDGALVTTSGALTNVRTIDLDTSSGDGGSELAVEGGLTNSGVIQIGNSTLSDADEISATSITNFIDSPYGGINLSGGASMLAELDIDRVASFGVGEVLEGEVNLSGDSFVEFMGANQIKTIASGSELSLTGSKAFIADAGLGLTSNTALTGLNKVDGELALNDGAQLLTSGPLTNAGTIHVSEDSELTVQGTLTNDGSIIMGVAGSQGGQSGGISASTIINYGSIALYGNDVEDISASGNLTNDGAFNIISDSETITNYVGGTGSFNLEGTSTLQFDWRVTSGEAVDFTGADETLVLKQASIFAGEISGFGFNAGDKIDVLAFDPSTTTFHFAENNFNTGGVLTLTSGTNIANIHFEGVYTNSDFSLSADSGTGTLVKFV